ncbi:Hypothetical protein SM11_pC0977 (plasmid) [Sinorhizobium meliloti SM11]|uniref:Uncharacterized protein n=2 Tax=Rhizobium meliloti TaxID=382 RepID=F7XES5_SINMM|nr:Hypothetical protein SM11_pC0977 [Sinorhizobium meliloti SM11]WKL23882.1 hypothetical protein Q1M63_05800 [Sinorhizobium meliloti]
MVEYLAPARMRSLGMPWLKELRAAGTSAPGELRRVPAAETQGRKGNYQHDNHRHCERGRETYEM